MEGGRGADLKRDEWAECGGRVFEGTLTHLDAHDAQLVPQPVFDGELTTREQILETCLARGWAFLVDQ